MDKKKFVGQSSSNTSTNSNRRVPRNKLNPAELEDYEYVGRLVTRERQIIPKSKSTHGNYTYFPPQQEFFDSGHHSNRKEAYEETEVLSSDDDDAENLKTPLGVIKINDRHFREIYRLPTPPPKIKRVFHRLKSPEPKIIERVFVRRPPPQIIENIIEIPPEKVRIINREKQLESTEPITRSKIVRLKPHSRRHHHYQQQPEEEEDEDENPLPAQQETLVQTDSYIQQAPIQTVQSMPIQQTATTTLVYPPQPNMNTVGYIESTVPPHLMFNSKTPIQVSTNQIFNNQTMQPMQYTYPAQQTTTFRQMGPTTPYYYQTQ